MASEFIPIFDRVVIKREKSALERKMSNAGLLTPDSTKSNYQSSEGTLVAIGEGCRESVHDLLGKKILFAKYSGEDFPLDWYGDDDEYVLMSELDIFGEIK